MRYSNNKWYNFETNFVKNGSLYSFFNATIPGFSTFAIVGSEVVETGVPPKSDDPEIPWVIIIGFVVSVTIILIIILFKARYIYFEKKESDETEK